jgi:hypothetical protein
MRSSLALVALLVVACSSSSSGDATTDGGGDTSTTDGPTSDTISDAIAADGGGVCCPIVGAPPCGCVGGGGWAESASQCPSPVAACDAWFDTSTDSHGCTILVHDGSKCCGCPPLVDSGKGDGDAVTDVSDAASE